MLTVSLTGRDLLRIGDLAPAEAEALLDLAVELREQPKQPLLAGASTIPDARGRGAQNALLAERLRYAAEHGCDVAMMGALPGSGSQRNAERNGFRVAYTRIKFKLKT